MYKLIFLISLILSFLGFGEIVKSEEFFSGNSLSKKELAAISGTGSINSINSRISTSLGDNIISYDNSGQTIHSLNFAPGNSLNGLAGINAVNQNSGANSNVVQSIVANYSFILEGLGYDISQFSKMTQ